MKISFPDKVTPSRGGAVIVGVGEGKELSPAAMQVDGETGGMVAKALAAGGFSGARGESRMFFAPVRAPYDQVLLFGLGPDAGARFTELDWRHLGGGLVRSLNEGRVRSAMLIMDAPSPPAAGGKKDSAAGKTDAPPPLEPEEQAAHLACGALLAAYRFDKYRHNLKTDDRPCLTRLAVGCAAPRKARRAFTAMQALCDGVFFARDLVSEPPNVLYPESFATEIRGLAELGIAVDILDEKAMRKLKMNALLGVAQGSARPARMGIMRWNGGRGNRLPVAFVGKGVTFDSGGISLKPGPGMEEMKWDMGGAGAVVGLMKALAGRKAAVNAVGIVGLVENMPDGNAQRPGDIVTTMSGQTVEIHNTDAEGRLVLADALWYVRQKYKPGTIIDLATLTGACIISLGHEYAGLFSNDDALAAQLEEAGRASGDKVWRLPLHANFDKLLRSPVADMKNIGGRAAGSITAAQFLQRFVKDVKWAHLDIAGMAWNNKGSAIAPKGATGFGVALLDRYVADNFG